MRRGDFARGAGLWVAPVAVVATLAAGASAQGPTTQQARRQLAFDVPPELADTEPRWLGDWSLALEEAQRRNVPVVAMLADEGQGFNTVRDAVYTKPEFAAFTRKCVMLAALDGRGHGSKPRTVDGREIAWCDLFGVPCDDHVRSSVRVRDEFAMREFWNPLQVFLSPQGAELGRVESHRTTQDQLDEELKRVRKVTGPGLDYEQYREIMARLRAIADQRERRGPASAHAEIGRMIVADAKAAKDPAAKRPLGSAAMVQFAESLQAAIVLEGEGLVEDADDLRRSRDPEGARKLLLQVQRGFKGLEPAKAAAKLLEKLPPPADPKKRG